LFLALTIPTPSLTGNFKEWGEMKKEIKLNKIPMNHPFMMFKIEWHHPNYKEKVR
jgi:hypothetical protein